MPSLTGPKKAAELAADGLDDGVAAEAPKRLNSSFHHLRFVVFMMGGFGAGLMLMLRYNIAIGILNMVNQTALYLEDHPNSTAAEYIAAGNLPGGSFNWSSEVQQMVMSWYMFTYTLFQIPFTKLSCRIGTRLSLALALGICALTNLLSPKAAYLGWRWLLALRVLNGVAAAPTIPLSLKLIEDWAPKSEFSLALTCSQLLISLVNAFSPFICGSLAQIDWVYVFYVPGLGTWVFCALWLLIAADNPKKSWLISEREYQLIMACPSKASLTVSPKPEAVADSQQVSQSAPTPPIEHKPGSLDVFRVCSFHAMMVLWICYCIHSTCFTLIMPTYLSQFMHYSLSTNGLVCTLIQTGALFSNFWPHHVLRFIQNRSKWSDTKARRWVYVLCCSTLAFTWSYVGVAHSNQLLMFFLNRCVQGSVDIVATVTLMSNFAHLGLSSIAYSIMNTVGNLTVVVASPAIGWYLDYTGRSLQGWCVVFVSLASTPIIMLVLYLTIIDSEPVNFGPKRPTKASKHNAAGQETAERDIERATS